ncbi:hypothetical protein ACQ5SO_18955 [Rhodovulum sp. DZ06]|uniref:hypothetical protein n=1 Tax=Rhodovulum sp. DZ06 TaxID=3425126 RepID=UPI003D336A73
MSNRLLPSIAPEDARIRIGRARRVLGAAVSIGVFGTAGWVLLEVSYNPAIAGEAAPARIAAMVAPFLWPLSLLAAVQGGFAFLAGRPDAVCTGARFVVRDWRGVVRIPVEEVAAVEFDPTGSRLHFVHHHEADARAAGRADRPSEADLWRFDFGAVRRKDPEVQQALEAFGAQLPPRSFGVSEALMRHRAALRRQAMGRLFWNSAWAAAIVLGVFGLLPRFAPSVHAAILAAMGL